MLKFILSVFAILAIVAFIFYFVRARIHARMVAVITLRGYRRYFENPDGCPEALDLYIRGSHIFAGIGSSSSKLGIGTVADFHHQAVRALSTAIVKGRKHGSVHKLRLDLERLDRLKPGITTRSARPVINMSSSEADFDYYKTLRFQQVRV